MVAKVMTTHLKNYLEEIGGFWMIDLIVSHQLKEKVSKERFQVWEFKLNTKPNAKNMLTVKCHDGNYNYLSKQVVPYTSLKKDVKLYFSENCIMLPEDY